MGYATSLAEPCWYKHAVLDTGAEGGKRSREGLVPASWPRVGASWSPVLTRSQVTAARWAAWTCHELSLLPRGCSSGSGDVRAGMKRTSPRVPSPQRCCVEQKWWLPSIVPRSLCWQGWPQGSTACCLPAVTHSPCCMQHVGGFKNNSLFSFFFFYFFFWNIITENELLGL